jgi:hypothetical protein
MIWSGLMGNHERHDGSGHVVTQADGGWSAVEYNGKPLVADKDAPRGRINFINWKCLALFVGMDFDFVGGGQNGEYLHYIENFDAYEIILRYYAELGTYRRNGLAAYVDIDESA